LELDSIALTLTINMLKKNNKYTLPEEYKFAVGYPEGIAEATLSLLWLLEKNSHFLLD
jgi:hypothetical protein